MADEKAAATMGASRDGKEDSEGVGVETEEIIEEASKLTEGAEASEGLEEKDADKLAAADTGISDGDAQHEGKPKEVDEPYPKSHATEGLALPAPSLARHGRLGRRDDPSRPGAYRVRGVEAPHRASSTAPSDEGDMEGDEPSNCPPPSRQPFDERAFMVEATLVDEEDPIVPVPSPDTSLLVAATPIRRGRQVMVLIAAVVVTASILGVAVGLGVGLARDRAPQQQPQPPDNLQFEASFRATLPPYTLESLQNSSSPQYRAYEWVMEHYQVLGALNSQNDESFMRATQRFALATLYFAMGGETSWNISRLWLSIDGHECHWHGCCCANGMTCAIGTSEGTGRVRFLNLTKNGLVHSLPKEISLLTNLEWLVMDNNTITGSVPTELGLLSALNVLTLPSNGLTSTIPGQLGSLTNLFALSLSDNELLGSIPTELGQLSALLLLFLSSNRLTSTIPTQLGALASISSLSLRENRLVGSIPTELGELAALTSLEIQVNQLNATIPPQLGNLTSLVFLSLRMNQLTGSIPTELSGLSALTTLYLSSNQLTSSIPTQLGLLTNLNVMGLHFNAFTGSIPTEMGRLSALEQLWISSRLITSTIPTEMGLLANMRDLALNDNGLTGPIPTQLGQLRALTSLWLNSNQLTSTIPTELGALSSLDSSYAIQFGNNDLSGIVPSELCQLKRDNAFDMYVDCEEVSCDCNCSCSEIAGDDTFYGGGL